MLGERCWGVPSTGAGQRLAFPMLMLTHVSQDPVTSKFCLLRGSKIGIRRAVGSTCANGFQGLGSCCRELELGVWIFWSWSFCAVATGCVEGFCCLFFFFPKKAKISVLSMIWNLTLL